MSKLSLGNDFGKLLLATLAAAFMLIPLLSSVDAQGFSGADIGNYYCIPRQFTDGNGEVRSYDTPSVTSENGGFFCDYLSSGGAVIDRQFWLEDEPAVPRPPTLRQIEIWFVRILYLIWAFAGVFFTVVLMTIGGQYLLSFGNEVALADVVKRIQKWVIGFVLVFLSYPLLNTFFAVLPIDTVATCSTDLTLPGFQIFFPEACVTPTLPDTPPVDPGTGGPF